MKVIKKSLERKTLLWLLLALFWSVLIGIACLMDGNTIPKTTLLQLPNKDKIAHFVFYFVFSILWFRFFVDLKSSKNKIRLAILIFLVASVLGMTMEVMQYLFTTTRSAEWADVIANSSGSLAGLVTSLLYDAKNKKEKLS